MDNIVDFTKKAAPQKKEQDPSTFEITHFDNYMADDRQVVVTTATGFWYEAGNFIYIIEAMTPETPMLVPVIAIHKESVLSGRKVQDSSKLN